FQNALCLLAIFRLAPDAGAGDAHRAKSQPMHRKISSDGESTASFCIRCRVRCAHTRFDSTAPGKVTAITSEHWIYPNPFVRSPRSYVSGGSPELTCFTMDHDGSHSHLRSLPAHWLDWAVASSRTPLQPRRTLDRRTGTCFSAIYSAPLRS